MLHSHQGAKNIINLLSDEQQQQLFDDAHTIHLVAGQTLFNKGEPANRFYLVKKGQIKLFRLTPAGDEKVFHLFSPGGWVAEMAMFMPAANYPMNAEAELPSELVVIKKEKLLGLVDQSPELARHLLAFMSQRIFSLVNNIDKLTFINASQRLVLHLAHLYQIQGYKDNKVRLAEPKRVLATQLNITPETLSRILRKFKSQDLIHEKGDSIDLLDIPTLCEEVELTEDIFQPELG